MPPDPWQQLRTRTPARIALGRAGGSLPTHEVLDFAMAHAMARDAVHEELDLTALHDALQPIGLPIITVHSDAVDRTIYLQRPDLGRQLSTRLNKSESDISLIVADGLSALAAQRHAPPLLALLVPMLHSSGLSLAPIVLATRARVAIEDPIGQQLGARVAVILLGERPGLGTPDSLGAYLVFDPKPGKTDAERNCISNIRPAGLPIEAAAQTLHHLLVESIRRKLSGVNLKDERGALT